ncbi:hypothetical protein Tco_0958135 [Tanacetum coccineum]
MSHDLPLPSSHTLGSDEGRMQHNELMDLVTKLLDRVVSLETDLQQIKKVYGVAYTKLIKKVKRLEEKLNKSRRRSRLGRHEHEMESDFKFTTTEDVSTANVPVNTLILLVQKLVLPSLKYEEALRLQEQLDKEERQRIARVQEEASSFNIKEWDDIQARVEADEEFAVRLLAEEREPEIIPKVAAGSSKRNAEEELGDESSKRQKVGDSSQQAEEPRD